MSWTNEDAVALREYLAKPSGKNFIENLKTTYTELGGKTFEESALIARERKGQEDMMATIARAAAFEEKPEVHINEFVNTNDSPR